MGQIDGSSDVGEARVAYPVTIQQARDFMSNIADEEFLWRKMAETGEWGGHLHRAILKIALMSGAPDAEVDIIPLYVDEYVKQPPHDSAGLDEGKLAAFALHYATENALRANRHFDGDYEARRDHALAEIESTFLYFDRSGLPPGLMFAFDEETRDRIRDKYFYARNGLTGERHDPIRFPDSTLAQIPDPGQQSG